MADLTIHTPSGLAIEIRLIDYLPGVPKLVAEIPARDVRGDVSGPLPLKQSTNGATHFIKIGAQAVGVTAEGALAIGDAVKTYAAAHKQTEQGRAAALRSERSRLAAELAGALDAEDSRRARAWNQGDEAAAVRRNGAFAAGARAALEAFDCAHPEVVAAIRAEADERAARHAWD